MGAVVVAVTDPVSLTTGASVRPASSGGSGEARLGPVPDSVAVNAVPTTRSAAEAAPTPGRSSRRGRALRVAAVGAVAVGVLAACEKPAPSVTVWAGTASVWTEASCWGTDAASPPSGVPVCTASTVQDALADAASAPEVAVLADGTVGISVDPVVADSGWYPAIGTQKLVTEPVRDTYYRFTFPAGQTFPAGGFPLEVVAAGAGDVPRGVWLFRLTNATAG